MKEKKYPRFKLEIKEKSVDPFDSIEPMPFINPTLRRMAKEVGLEIMKGITPDELIISIGRKVEDLLMINPGQSFAEDFVSWYVGLPSKYFNEIEEEIGDTPIDEYAFPETEEETMPFNFDEEINPVYFGFDNYDDLIKQFNISKSAKLMIDEILIAGYTQESYEGYAFVLFIGNEGIYEVNASHCSCYGLEDQWRPELTTFKDICFRLHAGTAFNHFDSSFINRLKEIADYDIYLSRLPKPGPDLKLKNKITNKRTSDFNLQIIPEGTKVKRKITF